MSVVAEAAFTTRLTVEATRFLRLAEVRFIQCEAPPDICHRRMAERAAGRPAGPTPFDMQGLELVDGGRFPWHEFTDPGVDAPTLRIDTTDGFRPGLEAIIAFLAS